MEKIFDSVRELDKRAEDAFNLKNGVLMEHAARGMAERIRSILSLRVLHLQKYHCRVCKLFAVRAITAAMGLRLHGCSPIFAPFG